MKKTRIISLLLAAVMICALLAGCQGNGGKTVLKVKYAETGETSEISSEIYSAAIAYANNTFESAYGMSMADYLDVEMEGKTGADMLKETALSMLKEFESVYFFAKANGIELAEEDKTSLKETKDQEIESAGGRKTFLDNLAADGLNENFYDYLAERQALYSKAFELYTGEGKFAPTTEEIAAYAASFARVKHVLIQAAEGDEDYETKKALAAEVAAKAAAGEDFEKLIEDYGEDPGMESNADGYIIDADGYSFDGSGQMITEFTDASFALADNGVSGVVPSSYGFHIIKRYPMDTYFSDNYDMFAQQMANVAFYNDLTPILEAIETEETAELAKVDIHEILGVEKTNGTAAGTTSDAGTHSEDDGHDHSTDTAEGTEVAQ